MERGADLLSRADVAWLLTLLWPEAAATGPGTRYGVITAGSRPRLVVPLDAPRAGAAAVARVSGDTSRGVSIARTLAAFGFRSGLLRPLIRARFTSPPGDAGLEAHLRRLLGREVRVAVTVGPPRPNRKPVLHLLDDDGSTLAFVKVGWNGLTRRLVDAEAAVLTSAPRSRLDRVWLPTVIHHGRWGELGLLVLSPLEAKPDEPVERRDPQPAELLEVFELHGTLEAPLLAGSYWHDLVGRATAVGGEVGAEALEALDRLGPAAGRRLRFGTWHGDWTPWNMTPTAKRLLVWDWERSTSNRPAGLDVAHYLFQQAWLRQGRSTDEAAGEAVAGLGEMLPYFGTDADRGSTVVGLYLVELSLRYAENAVHGTNELREGRHAQVRRALSGSAWT